MSFLGRARQALQGWSPKPTEPQFYDVACPEGHRLRGERLESYQALRCPACGEGVFVLPRSPFSDPRRQPGKRAPKIDEALAGEIESRYADGPESLVDPAAAAELDPEVEPTSAEDWVEPNVEIKATPTDRRIPAPPSTKRPSFKQRTDPRRPAASAVEPAEPAAGQKTRSPLPMRPSVSERLHRKRHLIAFLTVSLLVVSTALFLHAKQRRERLPALVERGRTEGLKALVDGKFDAANQILGEAARAVAELGGGAEIEGAEEIRQGALEASIFTDRVPDPLETILDEAARQSPSERQEKFRRLYMGRAIIVDDHIRKGGDSAGGFDLEYRVGVPSSPRPRIGKLDLKGFKLFERLDPKVGSRLVFGARLAGLRFDEAEDLWFFELEPASGVIMSWKPLEAFDNIPWEDLPGGDPAASRSAPNGRRWSSHPYMLTLFGFNAISWSSAEEPSPPIVELQWLIEKPDEWIGKQVVLDERIRYFRPHVGKGFDELVLQGADQLACEIPVALRPAKPPRNASAKLRGRLGRGSEGKLHFVIEAMDLLASDSARLEDGLSALPPQEYQRRAAWGKWARQRGLRYQDEELLGRSREIEGDALRIEAVEHVVADRPALWLELAKRARRFELSEPEPSALAHQAFRARLLKAKTVGDLAELASEVESFFSKSKPPSGTSPADIVRWRDSYHTEPGDTYRSAPLAVRSELDRGLIADTREALYLTKARANPKLAMSLAEEAKSKLPERAELTAKLRNIALEAGIKDVANLREAEVKELADALKNDLGQPAGATELYRRWLDHQKLGENDIEGRITLAEQYISILGDRVAAASLLRAAERIDPQSNSVSEAFRRFGFRKVTNGWIDAKSDQVAVEPPPTEAPRAAKRTDLQGMTRDDIIARMGGKPDRIVRLVTQGQILEQWIYRGVKSSQYIDFSRVPGDPQPTVSVSFNTP